MLPIPVEFVGRSKPCTFVALSPGLIGNVSALGARKAGASACGLGRGCFDKQTRRKLLEFAADAASYGI